MTTDINSDDRELTEEEMNQSAAALGLIAAAATIALVGSFATYKFMGWNDRRKAKKATQEA